MKLFGHTMVEKDWVVVGGLAAAVTAVVAIKQSSGGKLASGFGGTTEAFPGDTGVGGGAPSSRSGDFGSGGVSNGATPPPFAPQPTAAPIATPSNDPEPRGSVSPIVGAPIDVTKPNPNWVPTVAVFPVNFFPAHEPTPGPVAATPEPTAALPWTPETQSPDARDRNAAAMPAIFTPQTQSPDARDRNAAAMPAIFTPQTQSPDARDRNSAYFDPNIPLVAHVWQPPDAIDRNAGYNNQPLAYTPQTQSPDAIDRNAAAIASAPVDSGTALGGSSRLS